MSKSLIDQEFKILNHGFVRVVDLMGNDDTIVNAARVSYGKGTRSVSDNRSLIRYLLRKKHTSPFEQCEIALHIKCPIFVARQWIRHRTANINEISLRYSEAPDEFFTPDPETLKKQSTRNKQMRDKNSSFEDYEKDRIIATFTNHNKKSYTTYDYLINTCGLSRELARCALPVSLYTEFYWKMDLHNLFHFLKLRWDKDHAQHEIVVYAEAIGNIVKQWVPLAFEAFEDYSLNSQTFSSQELKLLKGLIKDIPEYLYSKSCYENFKEKFSSNEYEDFMKKLEKIMNSEENQDV